jgi:hypothetical protein
LGQVPGLEERTRARATAYLDGFFSDIATDGDVSSKILGHCVAGGKP